MANRLFIFRAGSKELVLPVTPQNYQVERGINVQVVNIHTLGDALLTGYGRLATIRISCMLPAHRYSFGLDSDPTPYIKQFEQWVQRKTRLRFIIGDTGVNLRVIVESFAHGERDGTNDVYADITLREFRQLDAPVMEATPADSKPREAPAQPERATSESYEIKAGDTLSAICRKYYGDGGADTYNKVAKRNGIANPNLIYAGKILQLPKPLN